MQTTRLSSKGQVIIPQAIRDAYHLIAGQELEVEMTSQGILLKTNRALPKTSVSDLLGCTGYQGKALSLDDMDEAIQQGVNAEWRDRDSY